jgi:rod shape-determining protein MreB
VTKKVTLKPMPRPEGGTEEGIPTSRDLLSIGIDLGTSRSAIATSHGARRYVESIVGFPKDAIAARRHGGATVLFGREALDHRLSLRTYRPLEKGVLKTSPSGSVNGALAEEFLSDPEGNRRAAHELIRHLVSLGEGKRDEKLHGVIGVPAQASVENKKALLEIAGEFLDRVLVVSQPFAVAYGTGVIDGALIVDIGAGTTDLCRMHGSLPAPEDQVSFPVAGDSVDEELLRRIRAKHPKAQVTITMAKQIKEDMSSLVDGGERALVRVPVEGVPTDLDLTEEVRSSCSILVDPLVEGIRKLIASHHPEFQDLLRNNIVLSGGGSLLPGLPARIEEKLAPYGGGRVACVQDPLFAGAEGALRLAADMPAEYWEKV